jgi:hypothetical protein
MERDESWGGKWENKTDPEKMIAPDERDSRNLKVSRRLNSTKIASCSRSAQADQPFQRSDAWQKDREHEIKTVMPFPRAKTRNLSDAWNFSR